MGWPPAVVIVVRHGARLDAADKQWHLTSPTPYDPPLTYGGFTQSKSLGARIASILRAREIDDEANIRENGTHPDGSTKKRRHKVVIHTSPFQRCVQTSIGIAAGLAQNPGHLHRSSSSISRSSSIRTVVPGTSPPLKIDSPRLTSVLPPIPEPKKSTIRVDAFLGEWLSPDYFEQITPPPSSIMMVASAKADLLRREDHSNLAHHTRDHSSIGSNKGFPGGWSSPTVDKIHESPFNMGSMHHALPRRDRTSSLSSTGNNGTGTHFNGNEAHQPLPQPEHGVYKAPIPPWAISSSDPIPQGYVSHARDACVNVDYQWDSMRAPQNWGSGGEYGEEWSSMHKRFRKGLQNLVGWYSEEATPFDLGSKNNSRRNSGDKAGDGDAEEEDVDEDLVIILVTHGAGCNALIGALTNHPVLIDVGMASLTMAVRKAVITPKSSPEGSPPESPSPHSKIGQTVVGISDQYEVKLIANTEHLRSSTSGSGSSRSASISSASGTGFGIGSRYPLALPNGSMNPFEGGMTYGSHRTYLNNNLRRTGSNASQPSSLRTTISISATQISQRPSSSFGLWSATPTEDEAVLNFGDEDEYVAAAPGNPAEEQKQQQQQRPESPQKGMWLDSRFDGAGDGENDTAVAGTLRHEEEGDEIRPLGSAGGGGGAGLWGSPRPPGDAERLREIGPKRRWTVTQNSS